MVTNCTFTQNSASSTGGGVYNTALSIPTLTNCILWGDLPNEVVNIDSDGPVITYCDVQGGFLGVGNIDTDPMFIDATGTDNIPGTEDDNLRLILDSPCIDAGDNRAVPLGITTDLEGQFRFVNVPASADTGVCTPGAPIVDMGAYELQASPLCPSDADRDGDVDLDDLQLLLFNFGTSCN